MIELRQLVKKFGERTAVDRLDLQIAAGEVFGLLGPNGAGKTTIIRMLTMLTRPTAGEIRIGDCTLPVDAERVKAMLGIVPQHFNLDVDLTVGENLDLHGRLHHIAAATREHRIEELLEYVELQERIDDKVQNLSGGMKRRLMIARALFHRPRILFLDEPTVGLDPKQIIEIRNLIARLGKNHTIILSSHILSEIQAVCKRVIIINKGQIIADDTPENLSNKLSSDHSLVARIVAGEQEMIDALSTVKGVKSVTSLGRKEDGSFDFLIEPEHGADIRAEVFKRIVSRGKTLLSLTSNKVSLEQIFLRLTEAADNDEAKRMLGITEKTETAEKPSVEIADDGSVTVKTEQAEEAEQ